LCGSDAVDSVSQWVDLAHRFVDTKVGKQPVHQTWTPCSDEDFSFHLSITLCFFFEHHPRAQLNFFVDLLQAFLKFRLPWLLPGLEQVSGEILLGGHNMKFPQSGLDWPFVLWVIELSRSSAR
jgi:hypothetical protein